jgi:hypothetical protein
MTAKSITLWKVESREWTHTPTASLIAKIFPLGNPSSVMNGLGLKWPPPEQLGLNENQYFESSKYENTDDCMQIADSQTTRANIYQQHT